MIAAIAIAGAATIGLIALTAALVGDDAPTRDGGIRVVVDHRAITTPAAVEAPVDLAPVESPASRTRPPGRVLAATYTPVSAPAAAPAPSPAPRATTPSRGTPTVAPVAPPAVARWRPPSRPRLRPRSPWRRRSRPARLPW